MKSGFNWYKSKYIKLAIAILALFCFAFLSCGVGNKMDKGELAESKEISASQKIALAEILSKADNYDAKVVKIAGVFKGWKGKCASSFSITRSDWILGDGPDCIRVSGKLPSGVSAARPGNERIEVTGKVKVAADGKVHLKAIKINVFQ